MNKGFHFCDCKCICSRMISVRKNTCANCKDGKHTMGHPIMLAQK